MSYKNTMKLFVSNFTLVWKQVVYVLCCLILLAICSYTTIKPIIALMRNNGIFAEFDLLLKSIYSNPNDIIVGLASLLKNSIVVLFKNFSKIYLSFFGAIFLCFLLPFILFQITNYNLSSIIYQKSTMNMNVSYTQNMISVLKRSLVYAFSNILFKLPYLIVCTACTLLYLYLAKTILFEIIGLIILSAILIFIHSLKISVFSYYTGYMVSSDMNVFKAFSKSIGHTLKDFWKNISSSIILYLTIIVINSFLMVFTFFAGLLVSIPATFVIVSIYYVVSFLNADGQRYYLSDTIIYNPVKYNVKKDDFVTITIPEVEKEIQVENKTLNKKYKNKK